MSELIVGMIPARWASSRFPGKPLAPIAGRPMILHVLAAAQRARRLDAVRVLTDDERIAEVVRAAGGTAMMTAPELPSGTDRLAAAAATEPGDLFVNIQGDEPLLDPLVIDVTVEALLEQPDAAVATPVRPARNLEEVLEPNSAKVVLDRNDRAIYFSRAPIPWQREREPAAFRPEEFLLHVGLYVYRREVLEQFSRLQSRLEQLERLEQLRFIENGLSVLTVPVDYAPLGVDVPGDIARVETIMRNQA